MDSFSVPRIRVIRLGSRNPLVGAALLLVGVAIVLALVLFGMMILAGLAAVGGVALLARRLLGVRGRSPGGPPATLDPSKEVFARPRADHDRQLPPRDA